MIAPKRNIGREAGRFYSHNVLGPSRKVRPKQSSTIEAVLPPWLLDLHNGTGAPIAKAHARGVLGDLSRRRPAAHARRSGAKHRSGRSIVCK